MTDGVLRSRLRVLVVGSSVGHFVRPPGRVPTEDAVDGQLERLLRAKGLDAEVRNDSRWFDTIVDGQRRLPHLLTWYRPDVIVVLYGYIESQPLVCPRWFAKWIFSPLPRLDPVSAAVRGAFAPTARRAFLRGAPKIASVPGLPSRVSPDRVAAELRRYITVARKERGSLVLCANVPDTDDRIEATLPTTRSRLAATSDAVERAVADAGDAARLLDLRSMVRDGGPESMLPDGIHLSAAGHQRLAQTLEAEIERNWMA